MLHATDSRNLTALVLFAAAIVPSSARATEEDGAPLKTVAERSDYQATATYQQVIEFCGALEQRSSHVTLTDFGKSHEGRSLPLLIISKSKLQGNKPWRQAKLPTILCVGNIHAGEVCGKEALLALARDLVGDKSPALLEHFVLLIAPIYNADGNERITKDNRPNQVGPAEGTGQRANAMGLDLNRDFTKLQAPESHAMVRLMRNWDPAIVIDTHTTNGSHHRYTLTYGGPRHPAMDPAIADFLRLEFLPGVSRALAEKTKYETFFYGNFDEAHERWTTYPALPRYGAHYVGLRNRLAILSEAYAYAPYKDRVLATRGFVGECLDAAVARRDRIASLVKNADANARKAVGSIALRHRLAAFDDDVVVKGVVEEEKDGKRIATTTPKDYEVEYWAKSEATHEVALPQAYFVAPDERVVESLQRHGIQVEQLREDIDLPIEVSLVQKTESAEKEFQGRRLLTVEVKRELQDRRVMAGTIVVRTTQPLGRLAAFLLEPESEDGLATWGFFPAARIVGAEMPVYRAMKVPTLLTAGVRPLREERTFGRRVTFESVYGNRSQRVGFSAPSTSVRWMPDGEHFLQVRGGKLHQVVATSGASQRYPDPRKLLASVQAIPSMDEKGRRAVSESTNFQMNPQQNAALIVHGDDLYHLPFDGSPAQRLTRAPGREELAQYSPDGQFVAYVRNDNLHVSDLRTCTEQTLTADGGGLVKNGKASWVYFEELYRRNWRAFWWSPDSRHLAFHRFDDTGLPTFHALNTITRHSKLRSMAHPKPGDPNPAVKLGVAHVSGTPVKWVDLSQYSTGDFLVSHVGWRDAGDEIYFYVQDRAQTWLDFRTCGIGSTDSDLRFRETTDAWVESPGKSWWVGDEILFLSERSGWKHLYAFHQKTKVWRAITEGEWEIRQIHRVDQETGQIYFSAPRRSQIASDLYRCRIDGQQPIEQLTHAEGTHRVSLAPQGDLAVLSWSSTQSPGRMELINTNGQGMRTLDTRPTYVREEFQLGHVEHVQIRADDEFLLEARVTYPPDFDASKRYPVWFSTYGGPHAPTIRNSYSGSMRSQMLANMGIVVLQLDPRSASGKGAKSTWAAYRQLGVQELKDIECGIRWLTNKSFIDASRVGISGHSYGGFITAYAMTHSKLFSAGISGAPVTDWRNYDTIYTERYMGTPQDNPEGYNKTSVVKAAKNLHGKLLLLHGMMDDNVHVQNSTQLIHALQQAGKQFDVMFYPLNKHGLGGAHYNKLVIDFIAESLDVKPSN